MDQNEPREPGNGEIPPKLIAAFKRLDRQKVFVPPSLDRSILNEARLRLSTARPSRWSGLRPWLLWPGMATACAALILAGYGIWRQDGAGRSPMAHEDLNQDGRVDILDAFQLARHLTSREPAPARYDFNGDGLVDIRDAEAVAMRAVKLGKGGRS